MDETIQIGGTGRPIVGQFRNTRPDGNDFDWSLGRLTITRLADDVVIPEYGKLPIPSDVDRSNAVAVYNWYQKWKTTEEGLRFDKVFTLFWKAMTRSASYGIVCGKDGSFRVDDIPPGRYVVDLYVNIPIPPEQRNPATLDGQGFFRSLRLPFWGDRLIWNVPPPEQGVWSDKPVDLGTQQVKLESDSTSDIVPNKKTETKTDETAPMRLTVLDADGKPIAGATGHASRVDRDNKRPGANFTTDENGVAQIERTTPENASWACFNIKAAGYTPYFAVWQRDREPVYPPAEFTIKLDKAKTIGGVVLDPDGKAVDGVKVEFSFPYGTFTFNDDSTHCAASGRTDAEGRWTCGYVPMDVLGTMRFYLHHPDLQSTQIDADLDDVKADGDGIFSHVFTIQRGYEINGTVKDESGKAIADARVEIQFFGIGGTEKDMYRRTTTDAEGRYRFATCPLIDSAAVVAQAPGFAGRYVETPIGSEPKTVDLVLGPSKPLKLRFTDEKGKPIENPWVTVSRWGPLDGTSIAPPIQKMLKAENYEPLKLDDGNGNWIWNDALAGPFHVAVGAEGFMTRQYVDVEAKDEVQTIVLKPWLEVAGTVVDDETGKPIPAFRIAEGYGNVAEGHVSWQSHGKREGKDGSFLYVDNQPQRFGRRLRIEADGYENGESRLIENDEGSIDLTFRMKKAEAKTSGNEAAGPIRSGLVLMPDGKPAAEAWILVSMPPNGIYVSLNSLDHHLQAKTDRDGKFTLPAIKFENDGVRETGNRFALILIHEDGCRYILDNDFEQKHNVTKGGKAEAIMLQPWGELEGTLMIGNRPGEGSQIGIYRRDRDIDSLRFDFHAEATTGKDGKFAIRKLFPGEYSVSRSVVTNRSGGSTRSVGAISKWVTVESGKRTEVTLGGTGRPVVGRVVGTPEAEKLLKTGGRSVRIRAPYPPYPEALETPIEIGKIRSATQNDPEKGKELFAAWQQTEAGKKYLADAEAVQREWNAVHKRISEDRSAGFGGKINDDGSFRVEDVESGDWVLEINAFDDDNKSRIRFEHPFTVPEIPGGRSDEALDLGTLRVEMKSTMLPPPQALTIR